MAVKNLDSPRLPHIIVFLLVLAGGVRRIARNRDRMSTVWLMLDLQRCQIDLGGQSAGYSCAERHPRFGMFPTIGCVGVSQGPVRSSTGW
jgi:hypothetical protein